MLIHDKLATYPKSKTTLEGGFSPNLNETFRCGFNFKSHEQSLQAYKELIAGTKVLTDFIEYMDTPRYAVCT